MGRCVHLSLVTMSIIGIITSGLCDAVLCLCLAAIFVCLFRCFSFFERIDQIRDFISFSFSRSILLFLLVLFHFLENSFFLHLLALFSFLENSLHTNSFLEPDWMFSKNKNKKRKVWKRNK